MDQQAVVKPATSAPMGGDSFTLNHRTVDGVERPPITIDLPGPMTEAVSPFKQDFPLSSLEVDAAVLEKRRRLNGAQDQEIETPSLMALPTGAQTRGWTDPADGRNIRNLLKNVQIKTTNKAGNRQSRIIIDPQNRDYFKVEVDFEIPHDYRAGDYFDIHYSNNVTIEGGEIRRDPGLPAIVQDGVVIARAIATGQAGLERFQLTHASEHLNGLKGKIKFDLYGNIKAVFKSENQDIVITAGNTTVKQAVRMNYKGIHLQHGLSHEIIFDETDRENGTYTIHGIANHNHRVLNGQVLSPSGGGRNNPNITIRHANGWSNSTIKATDSVKVYRLTRDDPKNESIYYAPNKLREEVTDQLTIDKQDGHIVIWLPEGTRDAYYYKIDSTFTLNRDGSSNPRIDSTLYANGDRYNQHIFGSILVPPTADPVDPTPDPEPHPPSPDPDPQPEPPADETTYTIGDYVWEDTNQDGIQDADENGLADVRVLLYDEFGTVLDETTTDSSCHYQFTGRKKGIYLVNFIAPNGYEPTVANEGTVGNNSRGETVLVKLIDKYDLTMDAGFYREDTEYLYEMTTETVPYDVIYRENPNLPRGVEIVAEGGAVGRNRVIYRHKVLKGTPVTPPTDANQPTSGNSTNSMTPEIRDALLQVGDELGQDLLSHATVETLDSQENQNTSTEGAESIPLAMAPMNEKYGLKSNINLPELSQQSSNSPKTGTRGIEIYEGRNISSLLKNASVTLTNVTSQGAGDNSIKPYQKGRLDAEIKFDIAPGCRAGDFFDIDFTDNVTATGLMVHRYNVLPNLVVDNVEVAVPVDTGQTNKLRYQLTYFSEHVENISAKIKFPLYINPRKVLNTTPNRSVERIILALGNNVAKATYDARVYYEPAPSYGNLTNKIMFTDMDIKKTYTIHGVANTNNSRLDDISDGGAFHGYSPYIRLSRPTNPQLVSTSNFSSTDTVKLYRVPRGQANSSLYHDTSQLVEETNFTVRRNLNNGNNLYIWLPSDVDYTYYYVVESKFDVDETGTAYPYVESSLNAGNRSIYFRFNTERIKPSANADGDQVQKYSIGDFVWEDTNKNGIQDLGEAGIAGVKVLLYDGMGNVLDQTVTDSNGNYTFQDKRKGVYLVVFETPQGYEPTKTKQGPDGTNSRGERVLVKLLNGSDMTIDCGFVREEEEYLYEMTTETVPFTIDHRDNPNLPKGVIVVVEGGTVGKERVLYRHKVLSTADRNNPDFVITKENYKDYYKEVKRWREVDPKPEIREIGTMDPVILENGKDGLTPKVTAVRDEENKRVIITITPQIRQADGTIVDGESTVQYVYDGEKGEKGDRGEQGLQGAKGEKGDPGKDGRDGLSPTVTVKRNKDNTGSTIVITERVYNEQGDIIDGPTTSTDVLV